MTDAGLQLLLAFSAAIVAVLILRKPVRAAFGARLAYALWPLPPLVALASFLPPRVINIIASSSPVFDPVSFEGLSPSTDIALPVAAPFDWSQLILPFWLAGAAVMAIWFTYSQRRFLKDERVGKAGPAVVGFLRPRIVTPADFDHRFDQREREMILTHETIHLRRHDARINALVALIRCLLWFNPLVHIGAYCLRIDQELACDAGVIARRPNARRLYADALLKAQLAARPLPLGCYWPPGSEHPLTERIALLKKSRPGLIRRLAGAATIGALALGAGVTAWAALPPQEHLIEQPQQVPLPKPHTTAEEFSADFNNRFLVDDAREIAMEGNIIKMEPGPDGALMLWVAADRITNPNAGLVSPRNVWRVVLMGALAQHVQSGFKGGRALVDGYPSRDSNCDPTCVIGGAGFADVRMPDASAPAVPERPQRALDQTERIRAQPPAPPIKILTPAAEAVLVPRNDGRMIDAPVRAFDQPPSGPAPVTPIAGSGIVPLKMEETWKVTADSVKTDSTTGIITYEGNVVVDTGVMVLKFDTMTIDPKTMRAMVTGKNIRAVSGRRTDGPAPPTSIGPEDALAARLGLLPGEKVGPAFASLFDADAPILFTGKVTKVEIGDPNSFAWVQATDATGAAKAYKVMGGRARLVPDWFKDPGFIGKTVTVRGYLAKDKSCADGCLVNGRDVTVDGVKREATVRLPLPPAPVPLAPPPPVLPPLPPQ